MAAINHPFNPATVIRCATTEYMNRLKQADPSLQGRLDAYELRIQEFIRRNNNPTPNTDIPGISPTRP